MGGVYTSLEDLVRWGCRPCALTYLLSEPEMLPALTPVQPTGRPRGKEDGMDVRAMASDGFLSDSYKGQPGALLPAHLTRAPVLGPRFRFHRALFSSPADDLTVVSSLQSPWTSAPPDLGAEDRRRTFEVESLEKP